MSWEKIKIEYDFLEDNTWVLNPKQKKQARLDFFRQKFQQLIEENEPEKGIEWMQEGHNNKDKKGFTEGFNYAIRIYKEKLLKAISNEKR